MARVIKHIEEATWYAPDVDDNRDDSEPFMVLLTPLSGAQMRKLEQTGMQSLTKGRGQVNFYKRVQDIQEKIIKDRVTEVKNYTVMKPDKTVFAPKDGKELLEAILLVGASEAEVIDDIVEALKDASKLSEGIIKNSK